MESVVTASVITLGYWLPQTSPYLRKYNMTSVVGLSYQSISYSVINTHELVALCWGPEGY